jgi:hypothetical protein
LPYQSGIWLDRDEVLAALDALPAATVGAKLNDDEAVVVAIAAAMALWSRCLICGGENDDAHDSLPHSYEGPTDAAVAQAFRDALPAATTAASEVFAPADGELLAHAAKFSDHWQDCGCHEATIAKCDCGLHEWLGKLGARLAAPAVPAPAPETDDERWARLSAKQPAVPVAQPDQFGESNDLNGLIQPTRSPEELAAEIIDAIPAMPDPWGEPDGEPHKTVVALIRAYLKGD